MKFPPSTAMIGPAVIPPDVGFSPTPDKPPLIVSIQALRALAVLMVLSMHVASAAWILTRNPLWEEISKIASSYGHGGVDLFFVISGTIMYLLTRTPRHRSRLAEAADYLGRRAFRIYPLFWITLAVAFAYKTDHTITLEQLFLVSAPSQHPVAWTLPLELRFYLVVGVLLLIARTFLDKAFVAWTIAQIAVYALARNGILAAPFFGSPLMIEFSMGLCTGALIARRIVIAPRILAALSAFCIVGACIATYAWDLPFMDNYRYLLYGAPFAVLVYAIVTLENLGKLTIPGLLRGLGDVSYSIYLCHFLILDLLFLKSAHASSKFVFGLRYAFQSIVISLILSVISYQLIEKPGIALGRQIIDGSLWARWVSPLQVLRQSVSRFMAANAHKPAFALNFCLRWGSWLEARKLPIAVLATFVVLFSRRGSTLTRPQIWDEDGILIVPQFLLHGWSTLKEPMQGYLTTISRLISYAALTLAPHDYALVSTFLAWMFTAAVAAYIAAAPTLLRGRLWLALACLLVPTDPEVFGTPLYAFWWSSLLLMLLPFWERGPSYVFLRAGTLIICGLSSPIAILTAPMMVGRALLLRNRVELSLAAVAILCAGIQIAIIINEPTISIHSAVSWPAVQSIVEKFFGWFVWTAREASPSIYLFVSGLTVVAAMAFAAWNISNRWVALGLLYLLAGSIATSVLRVDIVVSLNPIYAGPRYFFYPFIVLAWLLIEGCFTSAPVFARLLFAALLALGLGNAIGSRWSRTHDDVPWGRHFASCMHFDTYSMPIQYAGSAGYVWHADYSRSMCEALGGASGREDPAALYPFSVRPPTAVDATGAVHIISQNIDGSAPPGAQWPGFKLVGSFVAGGADEGEVTLGLERGARVLFASDANQAAQRYSLQTPDRTFSGDLPPCPKLCTLDFSSDLLPDQFSVTFSDEGSLERDWFAVGVPAPLPPQ